MTVLIKIKRKKRIKRNRRLTDNTQEKLIKQYKLEAKEATESILMDVMNQGTKDFDEYAEEVLDWSWDSIMND